MSLLFILFAAANVAVSNSLKTNETQVKVSKCSSAVCSWEQCSTATPYVCISGRAFKGCARDAGIWDQSRLCISQCDKRSCSAPASSASSLTPLSNDRWFHLDPSTAFNAAFNRWDYVNGACNGWGHWKDARFMKSPYITTTPTSIRAANVGESVQKHACIYQHTMNTCKFQVGAGGLMQLEFDYSITGDTWSNWFSFWLNSFSPEISPYHSWVPEAEIDMLEEMNKVMGHNFAGFGHQVPFKKENLFQGHVTLWVTSSGAQATDCKLGMSTCPRTGDLATQNWSSRSTQAIKDRKLWHFFAIDYWNTNLQSTMTVSNIRMLGSSSFHSQCPVAIAE